MAGSLDRVECPECGKFLCRADAQATVEVKCRCGRIVLHERGQTKVVTLARSA